MKTGSYLVTVLMCWLESGHVFVYSQPVCDLDTRFVHQESLSEKRFPTTLGILSLLFTHPDCNLVHQSGDLACYSDIHKRHTKEYIRTR